jgi:branched-chain amino acid transport system substrate-binding protein
MVEGAVGVLPLVYDTRPGAEAFVQKFKKTYDRNPGSEAAYHYSTLYALADAMKAAGTVSDPKAIHARFNDAFASLPVDRNPARITGVDEHGGSNAKLVVGMVKNGKVVTIDAAAAGE